MGEKTDWRTPVIVVVAVVVVAIILWAVIPKKVELEPLTDEDFKILSASWNTYQMDYQDSELISNINNPLDWNFICEKGSKTKDYKTSDWSMEVYATKNMTCNAKIDGIDYTHKPEGALYSGSLVKEGQTSTNVEYASLDPKNNHNIVVCCISKEEYYSPEDGEVCKSITLPAKCPLN